MSGPGCDEHLLVHRLRTADCFVPGWTPWPSRRRRGGPRGLLPGPGGGAGRQAPGADLRSPDGAPDAPEPRDRRGPDEAHARRGCAAGAPRGGGVRPSRLLPAVRLPARCAGRHHRPGRCVVRRAHGARSRPRRAGRRVRRVPRGRRVPPGTSIPTTPRPSTRRSRPRSRRCSPRWTRSTAWRRPHSSPCGHTESRHWSTSSGSAPLKVTGWDGVGPTGADSPHRAAGARNPLGRAGTGPVTTSRLAPRRYVPGRPGRADRGRAPSLTWCSDVCPCSAGACWCWPGAPARTGRHGHAARARRHPRPARPRRARPVDRPGHVEPARRRARRA